MEQWKYLEEENNAHPLKDGKWVEIEADIRRNATGEVRVYTCQAILDNDAEAPNDFIWEDGNYACDCNRRVFFQRAGNETEGDFICTEGEYSVRLRNPITGKTFYSELD